MQLGQLTLDAFERLHLKRRARRRPERTTFAVFIELLSRAVDRVLFGIQQMLHEQNQLHFASRVHPVTASILRRIEQLELALPIAEHMRLETGE